MLLYNVYQLILATAVGHGYYVATAVSHEYISAATSNSSDRAMGISAATSNSSEPCMGSMTSTLPLVMACTRTLGCEYSEDKCVVTQEYNDVILHISVDWESSAHGYELLSISPDHDHLVVSLTTNHLLLIDLPEYYQVL